MSISNCSFQKWTALDTAPHGIRKSCAFQKPRTNPGKKSVVEVEQEPELRKSHPLEPAGICSRGDFLEGGEAVT